jgi:protein TonB
MPERLPLWILPALAFALLVNGVLFLLLASLTQTTPSVSEMTEPAPVHLVRVREQEPPPPEEEPLPPEREEPEEIPEFVTPDLRPRMEPLEMDPLPFPVELNPRIMSGPPIAVRRFYDLGELDHPPRPLVKMPPMYPFKAKRLEIEGYVKVKFLVDEEGAVSRLSILEASPKGVFEASVLQSLPTWKFSPGVIMGEPVASWVVTTIRFELK